MSFRKTPLTTEELLADILERLRKLEAADVALPAGLRSVQPAFLDDLPPRGENVGDLLAWSAALRRWVVVPAGVDGQHLEADSTEPAGVRWVL